MYSARPCIVRTRFLWVEKNEWKVRSIHGQIRYFYVILWLPPIRLYFVLYRLVLSFVYDLNIHVDFHKPSAPSPREVGAKPNLLHAWTVDVVYGCPLSYVCFQELMALREDKAELAARLYLLEKERDSLELRLATSDTQRQVQEASIDHLQAQLQDAIANMRKVRASLKERNLSWIVRGPLKWI